MVGKGSTVEQVKAYVAALEREKQGYEARVDAAKNNRQERLPVEQLEDRIVQVDAELKRAKSLLGKKTKEKEEEPEEPAAGKKAKKEEAAVA